MISETVIGIIIFRVLGVNINIRRFFLLKYMTDTSHVSSIWGQLKQHSRGAIGSDVTGSHVIGSMFWACPSFPQRFFLTRAVVQVSWLPEVTLSGFPCVCACATGTGAISALVGPFDWR